MTQPPANQPPRHPGYGPNPPGAAQPGYGAPVPPAYGDPAQPGYAAPVYGEPGQPGYAAPAQQYPTPAQPGYATPAQHGYAGPAQPGQAGPDGRPGRNPLGLASLVVGAIAPILGLIFLFIQAAALTSMSGDVFGVINTVHTVLEALVGIGALVLGFVAISRRGLSKTLAAAGIALGAAALVGVLGALIYPVLVQLIYM